MGWVQAREKAMIDFQLQQEVGGFAMLLPHNWPLK
jgi:hypothetical protein